MAGGAASGQGQPSNPLLSFLPLIAIVVIMYFLMLRPQAKRQKEMKLMIEKLQKGDKVLTAGGIIGTIAGIKEGENLLILKISDDVKVEITRGAVTQVIKKKE
jgi:preprotein translocase subunit YajC